MSKDGRFLSVNFSVAFERQSENSWTRKQKKKRLKKYSAVDHFKDFFDTNGGCLENFHRYQMDRFPKKFLNNVSFVSSIQNFQLDWSSNIYCMKILQNCTFSLVEHFSLFKNKLSSFYSFRFIIVSALHKSLDENG